MADRFDIRKLMQFNTEVLKMSYDGESRIWAIETGAAKYDDRFKGAESKVVKARFVICATGCLSQSNKPEEMMCCGFSRF